MDQIKDVLPENLWRTMVRKLGREEALRLVWTTVVGPKLASQTGLRQLRGKTLVVSVPDAEWSRSLHPLETMILDGVNRFPDTWRAESIEFVVEPRPLPAAAAVWSREGFAPGRIGVQSLLESFVESEQKYFSRREESGS